MEGMEAGGSKEGRATSASIRSTRREAGWQGEEMQVEEYVACLREVVAAGEAVPSRVVSHLLACFDANSLVAALASREGHNLGLPPGPAGETAAGPPGLHGARDQVTTSCVHHCFVPVSASGRLYLPWSTRFRLKTHCVLVCAALAKPE